MKMSKGSSHHASEAGDAAVDNLNAKSLSAAKSGTSFAPATTPTPEKAPMKTTKGSKGKTMHHHHTMKKPADTAAAPEGTAAPADTSK
jgi:hypothetical protein